MELAFHQILYRLALWTTYVLFALTILGIWKGGREWLETIETMLNIYIAFFLIYNFNPFKKYKMDDFSREIAFSAGILLLVTKGVTHIFSELGIKDENRGNVRSTSDIAYEAVELIAR